VINQSRGREWEAYVSSPHFPPTPFFFESKVFGGSFGESRVLIIEKGLERGNFVFSFFLSPLGARQCSIRVGIENGRREVEVSNGCMWGRVHRGHFQIPVSKSLSGWW